MPLCGDAVFGEEGPAQSPLESLAGPAEKGSGSIGRATDEFSHVPLSHWEYRTGVRDMQN